MSGLFRPVGHLPAAAYWLRRVLLAGLALVVGWVLIGWLVPDPDPGKTKPTGTAAGASPSARPSPEPTPTPDEPEPTPPADESKAEPPADKTDETDSKEKRKKKATNPRDLGELPPCPDGTLSAEVKAADDPAKAGKPLPMKVVFTSDASDPCRIPVSPDTVRLAIVSGVDPIWNTEECDSVIPTGPLSLRPGEPRVITVTWPGRRSAEGCPKDTDPAQPGYYVVEVELNGTALDRGQFRLI